MSKNELTGFEIAIIGMDGRFPGAKNVDEFWDNLKNGIESIFHFTDEELSESGISKEAYQHPNYIGAKGIIDNPDTFDAAFFDIYPKEAKLIDPQSRVFLECAWNALEDSGYDAESYDGIVGVFAGSAMNTYLLRILADNKHHLSAYEDFELMLGSDKDLLSTRVSYKLNLTGPSVTVQSTCSTSLVAVHTACQSLLSGECDMAIAGGVSIQFPLKQGYRYQEGMIYSTDGHCRAFDANASGTIFSDGVGAVVLKRLEDAIKDRDAIDAVIKGTAINNDGALKVGFTAPSAEGQAKVIHSALVMADVNPNTISYVEAHGTGTILGDPIEISALTDVYRRYTDEKQFCAIGSVKTNIGHLNTASGIAGLIKTVLALKHKEIPPSLHFESPNPKIHFEGSPFYVNNKHSYWEHSENPRRAGVSSFGIGGTNAHAILEEYNDHHLNETSRSYQLLTLSAKTTDALDRMCSNLSDYLNRNPNLPLADVAYTLAVGRKDFQHRRFLVCQNYREAVELLHANDPKAAPASSVKGEKQSVIFLFPGQGSQYVQMGKELYDTEEVFKKQVDQCSEILMPKLGFDLRDVIYANNDHQDADEKLKQTSITQPSLFVTEYALAQLWMSWGIYPDAMIGHSVGEYVAACLSGVMELEDALFLIADRGKLIQDQPGGSMMALRMSAEEIEKYLSEDISLAAENGLKLCVVSGSKEAIDTLEKNMKAEGVYGQKLMTSHAFHSYMMDPVIEPYKKRMENIRLKKPRIPLVSNVTGTWMTDEEAVDPSYWAEHIRKPVLFSKGICTILEERDGILLEVGPGRTLSTLAKQQSKGAITFQSLRHPHEKESDVKFLLHTLGRLWLNGLAFDTTRFFEGENRSRVHLPTYPFERIKYSLLDDIQFEQPSLEENIEVKQKENLSKLNRSHLNEEYEPPRDELEEILVELLEESLGVKDIGIYDNFFDLGGNSLLASQVAAKIQERLMIEIGVNEILKYPNIAELSPAIQEIMLEEIESLTDEEAEELVKRS